MDVVIVDVLMMKFQVAQSLLVALYKLNATEMKAMLSVLPKNFQVCTITQSRSLIIGCQTATVVRAGP